MKKLFNLLLMTIFMAVTMVSCEKEEIKFELKSLLVSGINLDSATAPNTVPLDSVIRLEYTKDVDPTSVLPTVAKPNITLEQDYDDAKISLIVEVEGTKVTITPTGMSSGALYRLNISAVKSTSGDELPPISRTFTTIGSFVPAGQFAYWPFDGDANDAIGAFDPAATGVVGITYSADRKGVAGKAAEFNGDNSIIEIPNGSQLINTSDFTLSFWVKTNSTAHVDADGNSAGHFVMGLGAQYGLQFEIFGDYKGCKFAIQYAFANGKTDGEEMWLPSDAKDNTNGGFVGWDYAKDLTAFGGVAALIKDKWAHIAYTYNGTSKKGTMFINGVKMKSFDFNLWPVTDVKRTVTGIKYAGKEPDVKDELAFGFIQSRGGTLWDAETWGGYDFPTANHFKGSLDEIRIFHKALSAQEVELLHNSEKGN